jgi:hypothetical protein
MGGYIFQKRALHGGVGNLRGLLLQQSAGHGQNPRSALIFGVGLEGLVASEIHMAGLGQTAVRWRRLKVVQNGGADKSSTDGPFSDSGNGQKASMASPDILMTSPPWA